MDLLQKEKTLFTRIAKGEEAAYKEIFMRYKDRFYAAAFKMTKSQDLSEEVVQEVFLTLWLRRDTLAKVDNPVSYLFSIVYHSVASHFKKIAKERSLKEKVRKELIFNDCYTEKMVAEKEIRNILQQLIQRLPPQQKIIYQLSKQEGLTRNEIAKQLHISPNTVKNHLLKAMEFIRSHWEKHC